MRHYVLGSLALAPLVLMAGPVHAAKQLQIAPGQVICRDQQRALEYAQRHADFAPDRAFQCWPLAPLAQVFELRDVMPNVRGRRMVAVQVVQPNFAPFVGFAFVEVSKPPQFPTPLAPPQRITPPASPVVSSPPQQTWWCDAPRGYYPSVPRCSTPWRATNVDSAAVAQPPPEAPAAPPPADGELDCRNPQDDPRCAERDPNGRSGGPSYGQVAPQYPAPPSQAPLPQEPIAERAVLFEEGPDQGRRYLGSVIWRTEMASPGRGLAPKLMVRADVAIPERRMTVTWSLGSNTDVALAASHTVEITFNLPADVPSRGVSNVPGILMKQAEQARGIPLTGRAVKVTSGLFRAYLSAVGTDVQRNVQLLRDNPWLDIPIVYTNGSRAILVLEKGASGQRAFIQAFTAWNELAPAPNSAPHGLAERLDGAGLHADAPGSATPIQQSERAAQQTDPYADDPSADSYAGAAIAPPSAQAAAAERLAKTLGMSVEGLSAWQGAAEQAGGSVESISGALAGVSRDLNRFLVDPSQGSRWAEILRAISAIPGVEPIDPFIRNARGDLEAMDPGQLLLKVNAALAKSTASYGKKAATLSLAPGMNEATINLLLLAPKVLREYLEEARKATGTTKEESHVSSLTPAPQNQSKLGY
jgi:hypothetical protein